MDIRKIRAAVRTFLVFVVVALSSSGVEAVVIKGKIELSPPPPRQARIAALYPGKVIKPSSTSEKSVSRSAAVFLVPIGGQIPNLNPERYRMDQLDLSFVPHILAIPVGSTVDFYNLDPIFHNVFSFSKPKKFDLGRYPQGQSKSATFEKPGLIKVFCEIHSDMKAYILVLKTPYVAYPDREGEFIFRDIPTGEYFLRVWQETGPAYQERIEVPAQDTFYLQEKELAPVTDIRGLFELNY